MNKIQIITRILFILSSVSLISSQTAEELKRFMDTYDKLKVDQEANEVVKKGLESEKDPDDGPVRLLIDPGDMTKYYREKMSVIKKDLEQLNRILISSDSIPQLEHFGYNYFSLRDSIQIIDNATVPSNYVLGYGDEVIISIWGQAEQYERAMLERDGTVFIKNVGLLYFGGKTSDQAKTYLKSRFGKVYATLNSNPPQTFLEFSIGKIKNINITISGHVQFPGNYVVNPSISIPNILVLAGGVTETGTLRNIKLQREKTIIDSMDLYPLITGNGITKSFSFLNSDVIIVPPRRESVAVNGAVLNPAYYEISNGNSVKSLLQYAGGVISDGNPQVIIARPGAPNLYVPSLAFEKIEVISGDSLIIPGRNKQVTTISVSSNIHNLMNIPWFDELSFNTILDIMHIDPQNVRNIELVRRSKDDDIYQPQSLDLSQTVGFKIIPFDHLSIHLHEKFIPTNYVVVKGAIGSPGEYPLINGHETLNSILTRSGGLLSSSDIKNVIVKRDTLSFGSKTGDLVLSAGDTIIAKPILGTVMIDGEVHNPGNITWQASYSTKDYLNLAGGLTAYGDKKHIVYITPYGEASRISIRSNVSVLPGGIIHVSEKPLSEQNKNPGAFYQQISSIITSMVTLAILANSMNSN